MTKADLSDLYRAYIACLNEQDWPKLGKFVDENVAHNGGQIGLSGYREMLEKDFDAIPDLHFNIQLLISDAPYVACRLRVLKRDPPNGKLFDEPLAHPATLIARADADLTYPLVALSNLTRPPM